MYPRELYKPGVFGRSRYGQKAVFLAPLYRTPPTMAGLGPTTAGLGPTTAVLEPTTAGLGPTTAGLELTTVQPNRK